MGRIYKQQPHDEPVPRDPDDRMPSSIVPTCDCFVEKGMAFDRSLGIHKCSKCGAYEDHSGKTAHQQRIEEFMHGIGHQVGDSPHIPSGEIRCLRARIVFEEFLEMCRAMGVEIHGCFDRQIEHPVTGVDAEFRFADAGAHRVNLEEVADGAADVSVTTIGTLSAFGIADKAILEAVDQNNLDKVKPRCPACGTRMIKATKETSSHHFNGNMMPKDFKWTDEHGGWSCQGCDRFFKIEVGGYEREDGKWIKGTAHKKVDLLKVMPSLGVENDG